VKILFLLIPLSLVLLVIAVWAFFWAVGNGQFDDLDSPAYRILMDDDDRPVEQDERAESRTGEQDR